MHGTAGCLEPSVAIRFDFFLLFIYTKVVMVELLNQKSRIITLPPATSSIEALNFS